MKKGIIGFLVFIVFTIASINMFGQKQSNTVVSPYPYGKNFAFSITDDPDYSRLQKIKPIYDFFDNIGIKTTIAVWVRDAVRSNGIPDIEGEFDFGHTCQYERYRTHIKELQQKGFEIALHTVSGGNDRRNITMEGYEEFKRYFGEYPKINIMHAENLENVYWGSKVIQNSVAKRILKLAIGKAKISFSGEDPASPYFWGDILQSKTKYVRLWGTSDVNTLKFNPSMPYHDPQTPYVNYWFSFSDGYSPEILNKMISGKNIDRLSRERGTCIVYSHLGSGFTVKTGDGEYKLKTDFELKMRSLAHREDGWFVPVSTILDRLLSIKNVMVSEKHGRIVIVNSNSYDIKGLTIVVEPRMTYYTESGEFYQADLEGEIILDKIRSKSVVTLYDDIKESSPFSSRDDLGTWEKYRMVFERAKLFIKHRIIRLGYS